MDPAVETNDDGDGGRKKKVESFIWRELLDEVFCRHLFTSCPITCPTDCMIAFVV